MAIIVAGRSNGGEAFGQRPYYGLNFMDHPQNSWVVVQSGPHEFVLHVHYANNIGFYPLMITFRSESGFTYTPGEQFPSGVVSSIGTGFPGDGPGLPPAPDQNVAISGIAGLGLTVGDIVADPERMLAGDDVITGGTGMAIVNSDEIYAGDGNDTITGASTDGWYDLGRGNGFLDAAEGVDFARFDLSDRAGPVVYAHNNTEALATVLGVTAVTLRNVERVEVIGGAGYDIITGGALNDVINLSRGGGYADGGVSDGVDRVIMDFSDESRAITYAHDWNLAFATADGVNVAEVRNAEQVEITGGSGNDVLTGFDFDDLLVGGAGDDVLDGGGYADVLSGGLGNDRLEGGLGYDYVRMSVAGTVDLRITTAQNYGEGMDVLSGIEGVIGSEGGDRLIGTGETNTLRGRGGDDVIEGGGGNDILTGGTGHNILWGGDGDDRLHGTDDANIFTPRDPRQGSNEMHGGLGNDIIFGANGDDVLHGDEGDDELWGWGGVGRLYGGEGHDRLQGGGEDDHLEGGEGNDNLIGNMGSDVLIGGAGNDSLLGDSSGSLGAGGHDDILDGGDGDDQLNGGGGDDILRDAGGNDDLIGGTGFNIVDYSGAHAAVRVVTYVGWDVYTGNWARQDTGGSGSDLLVDISGVIGSNFDDQLSGRIDAFGTSQGWVFHEYFDGGAGNDIINGASGDDILLGGAGHDMLNGGDGDDRLDGGVGSNRLDGGAGTDTAVFAGARSDYTISRDGDVTLVQGAGVSTRLTGVERAQFADALVVLGGPVGTEGPDTLTAGEAGDTIYGLGGADTLNGAGGDDDLQGGGGDDLLTGAGGDDVLDGGDGTDTAVFAGLRSSYTVSTVNGVTTVTGPDGADTLTGVERLRFNDQTLIVGAGGGQYVEGTAAGETLTGAAFADLIEGRAGADTLNGEGGDDALRGGAGVDVLNGGAGFDTADYSTAAAGVTARLDSMRATNDGDGGTDTFVGIEAITGSNFNDLLIGGGLGDTLRGGLGADTLLGQGGADVLWGGAGAANQLQGGAGDDRYVLEAGDSVIESAGQGTDTVEARIGTYTLSANVENLVFGGVGNFTGAGNALNNTLTGGAGDDVLRGRGGTDVLQGGLGMDTADYSLAAAAIHARLDNMRAVNDGDGGTDTFVGIEAIVGSNFNDLLVGGGLGDRLSGGFGADTLLGFAGNDILSGGQGAANQLQGGLGDDLYILDAYDTVVELAGQGVDTVEAHVGAHNLGANVENMYYVGNNKFYGTGNALNNVITGGVGDDILKGMGGNDTLRGGAGRDEVQFRGAMAQYTVTAEGAGYRIVDSVAGRDGSTLVESIEVLRFMTGNTTTLLTYPSAAPAASRSIGKGEADDAQVLPVLVDGKGEDDAFVLPALPDDEPLVLPGLEAVKGGEEPLVLPGSDDATPLFLALEARLPLSGDWMLTMDGEPVARHDDWMM